MTEKGSNREYYEGRHACERDEPFDPKKLQEWKRGYIEALSEGLTKPQKREQTEKTR